MLPLLIPVGLGLIGGYLLRDDAEIFADGGNIIHEQLSDEGFVDEYAEGGGIDMDEVERKAIFYTDDSKWSEKPTIEKFEKDIKEAEQLKKQLDNKEIRPYKIIGSGIKPQYARKLAYDYLNENIAVAKRAIEILKEREYTKGGGVEGKKWIQEALAGGKKGALRKTAMKEGLLSNEDDTLSKSDLKKLQKMGGKTAKRAHLAETLKKFD
jgi:hypothetical protein